MSTLTPLQKAIKYCERTIELLDSPSPINAFNGKNARSYKDIVAHLKSLLSEERKVIENAFNEGWSKSYESHPIINDGVIYYDKTFCPIQ